MRKIIFWLKNARYQSLPQSITPAIVALSMAFVSKGFDWILALVGLIGAIVAHLAINLADDYFDYGVKSGDARNRLNHQGFRARIAKYEYLTAGKATMKQLLTTIVVLLAVAASLGSVVLYYRGAIVLYIALAGLVLGIFYSCPPLKLSYRGLGEIVIGLVFGPLLMTGVYYAACGQIDSHILFASIPIGLLVMNIIFTHSIMDRHADKAVGKMTFAILLNGKRPMLICCFILNFLPFFVVLVSVLTGFLHWLYLLVLVVIPRAVWLYRSMKSFLEDEASKPTRKKWLGRMDNWENIKQMGIDWFMIRWYVSRNLISSFCIIFVFVNIILALCF
ncbi:MAG: prenyltransferase [Bacteroidales bacterium]|jgi:1,4-dihydroxy-2-naphthoate octaprenyltransferase|nr:prenyltransferase [Bacteroidales bacterium]